MDVYRALNTDVPHILFTVLHQAAPKVSDEEFTRTVTALHTGYWQTNARNERTSAPVAYSTV